MDAQKCASDQATSDPSCSISRRRLAGCKRQTDIGNTTRERWRISSPETTDRRCSGIGPRKDQDGDDSDIRRVKGEDKDDSNEIPDGAVNLVLLALSHQKAHSLFVEGFDGGVAKSNEIDKGDTKQ